ERNDHFQLGVFHEQPFPAYIIGFAKYLKCVVRLALRWRLKDMPVWVLGLTEGFAKRYGRHWRPSQRETARVLQVGKHVLANGLARIVGSLAKAKRD
ncbi:hypothetical protein MUP77_02460, partial [Candidatus Bathyarchaeota archaeon]|nr:hypothetical protein [Candidatus Bathyarchaeota archaeon]